jgi:pyrimidine deaminase RibD-like protein
MSAPQGSDADWLLQAIELSTQCPRGDRSFAVGALIVDPGGRVVATGFSLELGPSWHAEEVALRKAKEADIDVAGGTLYSSLEPCSVRLSGKAPCVRHIIEAGISKVVFALSEPPVFVVCEGAAVLAAHGIEVIHMPEYGPLVEEINRHLLG